MMKKLILTILVLATGLTLGLPLQAATLKIATIAPEGSQWMKDMRAGAKEIKERTEGRVQIKYYGGGVMGNDQKVLSRIRIGSLQGGAFTPTALVNQYSGLDLYGLPMMFDSAEEASYVRSRMDSKFRAGLEEAGFVNFGFASGGFALLMSNTRISTFEDLKGKKVWIPEGDNISRQAMETLSLTPVTLPLTDVLTGLQTGLIDIVGMSPIGALVLQWHTKIKYISDLPLLYTFGVMVVDEKAFYKLSADDQAIVREVMEGIYRNFDETNMVDNLGARDALLNTGIEVVSFEVSDYQKVRESMMELNASLAEQGVFSKELYYEMLTHIDEYRSGQQAEAGPAN
jgi:TRAP-type C4-dicarboxylate transport system substrate-binding protein